MTTTFNGTEFVSQSVRSANAQRPVRNSLVARRDTRRNRRAMRAI